MKVTCRHCGHIHEISTASENEKILSIVLNFFGITKKAILSKSRTWDVVYPRHIAMYLLRKENKNTSVGVGKLFKRDHSTVLYATGHIKDLMFTDPKVKGDVENIEELLKQTA